MKLSLSSETSQKIVNLSFFCAMTFCIAHVRWCESWHLDPMFEFIRLLFGDTALSLFFAFSGYFLARHYGEPGWWRTALRKRIGTIVLPFCIWQLVNGVVWFVIEGRWSLRPGAFGLNPFICPKLLTLWYLRNLMVLVAVSPLVFWCLKRGGKLFLSLALVAWFAVESLMEMGYFPVTSMAGGFLRTTFSIQGLFAFSLGAYLVEHPLTLSRRVGLWCGVALLALVAVRLMLFSHDVPVPFGVLTVTTCLMLSFAWTHMGSFRLPKVLAYSVFPIYLMHLIILQAFCLRYFPDFTLFGPCRDILFGIGVPIVFSAFLHSLFPRVAHLAFGGR